MAMTTLCTHSSYHTSRLHPRCAGQGVRCPIKTHVTFITVSALNLHHQNNYYFSRRCKIRKYVSEKSLNVTHNQKRYCCKSVCASSSTMAAKITCTAIFILRTPADSLDFECGANPSGIAETLKGRRAH